MQILETAWFVFLSFIMKRHKQNYKYEISREFWDKLDPYLYAFQNSGRHFPCWNSAKMILHLSDKENDAYRGMLFSHHFHFLNIVHPDISAYLIWKQEVRSSDMVKWSRSFSMLTSPQLLKFLSCLSDLKGLETQICNCNSNRWKMS